MSKSSKLKEIALLFLKLGAISFGGPSAHIAMMEDEVVRKRKWITQKHFLDLIGATNLIPGPNSTEMTMHCGYERAGWKGLITAGLCFIFPAVSITGLFAWFYNEYGQLPNIKPFLYGIKPAVIAIIIMAAYKLGKKALKSVEIGILGIGTLIVCLMGVSEILALFSCGIIGLLIYVMKNKNIISSFLFIPGIKSIGSLKIFLTFLKVGSILYGSGYVLFAFLDSELVSNGWLSRNELMDAVGIGQFTPGPVLSTATFIGWQINGLYGAIAATIGIFIPSFIFVAILNPLIPKMRKSKPIASFLDAINIAAVAVIAAVCIEMGKETLSDWRMVLIGALSLIAVFVLKKTNSSFIVLGGAILGYILNFV